MRRPVFAGNFRKIRATALPLTRIYYAVVETAVRTG